MFWLLYRLHKVHFRHTVLLVVMFLLATVVIVVEELAGGSMTTVTNLVEPAVDIMGVVAGLSKLTSPHHKVPANGKI